MERRFFLASVVVLNLAMVSGMLLSVMPGSVALVEVVLVVKNVSGVGVYCGLFVRRS